MEDIRLAEGTRTLISHPLARAHRKNHRYVAGKGGLNRNGSTPVPSIFQALVCTISTEPRYNGSQFNDLVTHVSPSPMTIQKTFFFNRGRFYLPTSGSGCPTKSIESKFGFGEAKLGVARRGRNRRNSLGSGSAITSRCT